MTNRLHNLGFFFLTIVALSTSVVADDAMEFFKGKRMTYIVATKPGGGYDAFARMVAKYLPKYLPVQAVAVKNVPGAGHMIGLHQLYTSKPDGLTIGTFNHGLIYVQMFHIQEMEADFRKMKWLGRGSTDVRMFVVGNKSGIQSFSDLRNRETLIGSGGKTQSSNIEMELLARTLGFRIKPVYGFTGPEIELAMIRGDIAGTLAFGDSTRAFLEEGNGKALFYIGRERPSYLANIPALDSLVSDPKTREVTKLIRDMTELGRLIAAPPGVPDDRVALLREAVMKTLTDPELIKDAENLKLGIDAMNGAEVESRINTLLAIPPANLPSLEDLR